MSETTKRQQTADEILDSLTGHEETWVAEQFGRSIGELIPQPGMYRRALIFVVKRREGVNEDDARNAAMDMRLKDVLEFFPEAGSEAEQESGKGAELDELKPEPSLSSVS